MSKSRLNVIIDALEEEEAKLLSWGDTGGIFTETELEAICRELIPGEEVDDILDDLECHAMIYPIFTSSGQLSGYRTRMAHAVHLFRNLRQWMHGRPIESSKTLVSDFRFLRRPRRYPVRNYQLEPLLTEWSSSGLVSPLIELSIKAQIGDFQLSGFQKRATGRILEAWPVHKSRVRNSSATIVCAGTGSGKTMAFYLPGLSSLVSDLAEDASNRVRILAIYPRNELLKDQFHETWEACRKLDSITNDCSGRKIRIGALYSDVPENISKVKEKESYANNGLLKCRNPACNGQMRWKDEDIKRGIEKLTCHLCGSVVEDDEVSLTRKSMDLSPPDILFTTTEMLNQQIGRPTRQKLFGINTYKPVPLVLLDEVHTYGGVQGAQTAFLLRRWMQMSKSSPHFVGLSATLADAENFFARLTGTLASRVCLVEPLDDEITEEGSEYLVALRGDPVSQTALLSTTIQASMLTRRILDSYLDKPSNGTWGSKTFIFTDDLDVNNRLFSQLADAEGWWQRAGKLTPHSNGPLAQLRDPNRQGAPTEIQLASFGQDWSLLKRNGFPLNKSDRAIVSRTSSQDTGVQVNSDIVVATASLEVGYNDPDVGAVIQHKAPRSVASYLQRKGRAGRTREMRPWMIAILSDFGRDRDTYQQYQNLLDPEIKLQGLPINNSHIHRMQAAMVALNWIENKCGGLHLWTKFNFPQQKDGSLDSSLLPVLHIIEELLEQGILQDEFSEYIQQSLRLDEQQLKSVLWQPPRSIMLEFLPTVRRRIRTSWGRWDERLGRLVEWSECNNNWRSPVPEFISDQLFSDLNLPTVDVHLDRGPHGIKTEGMRFFQALKEFAPGRISKRFSSHSGQASDWVLPGDYMPAEGDDNTHQVIETAHVFGSYCNDIGEFQLPSGDVIRVLKPYQIQTQSMFNNQALSDTSNAFLVWNSNFHAQHDPEQHQPPSASLWTNYLGSVDFYTHRSMTPVNVARFNTGSIAEIKFKKSGNKARVFFDWHENGCPVGIGTTQSVDGLHLKYKFTRSDLKKWLEDKELLAALRSSYFQDSLRDSDLVGQNHFMADWVFECFMAALLIDVSDNHEAIENALENIVTGNCTVALTDIPFLLFQQNAVNLTEVHSDDELELDDQKLQRELVDLLENKAFVRGVANIARVLYSDLSSENEFLQWCFTLIGNTLSAALKQAVTTLLPDADDRSLVADPIFDVGNDEHTIWLTEEDSGGTGILTQLQDLYSEDPLQFLNVFAQHLQRGEYENLDADLVTLLSEYDTNSQIRLALHGVRSAADLGSRIAANKDLKKLLTREGFHFSHSFASVLHSRILKPGSSEATDKALAELLKDWEELERQVSLELPINLAAFVLAYRRHDSSVNLERVFNEACAIQAVLWPRGSQLRQSALSFYNPFRLQVNNRTERKLAAKLCPDETTVITLESSLWLDELHQSLRRLGRVDFRVPKDRHRDLNSIIAELHTQPIDTHGLLVYPRIVSIRHHVKCLILRIELAETVF